MNYKPMTRIDFLVVHCSATPADRDIGATDIRQWHRAAGYRDIGYHYVIKRDGTLETGRPEDMAGAHAKPVNQRSIGICLVGGSPAVGTNAFKRGLGEDNFTPEQMETLFEVLSGLVERYPDADILGHRDIKGVKKACPSFDVREWWNSQ